MTELKYKFLIDKYLENSLNVEDFIDAFISQWRYDRDNEIANDPKFQRLIDRMFTSCDCYSEMPQGPIEISEEGLKNEVQLLAHIWWG
jgi:hypothetical protein